MADIGNYLQASVQFVGRQICFTVRENNFLLKIIVRFFFIWLTKLFYVTTKINHPLLINRGSIFVNLLEVIFLYLILINKLLINN